MATNTPSDTISAHYRQLIETGELKPGDRFPSVREIAREWEVAKATAGRAVGRLRHEGWLTTGRGRQGTTVARSSPAASGFIAAFADAARQDGTTMETVNTFTFADLVPAPDYIVEAFHLRRNAKAFKRFRYRRTQTGEPVMMAESWIRAEHVELVPQVRNLSDVPGGTDVLHDALGITCNLIVESVSADLATRTHANFYRLKLPSAVKVVDHVWYADDYAIRYGRGWHRPDEWSFYRVQI